MEDLIDYFYINTGAFDFKERIATLTDHELLTEYFETRKRFPLSEDYQNELINQLRVRAQKWSMSDYESKFRVLEEENKLHSSLLVDYFQRKESTLETLLKYRAIYNEYYKYTNNFNLDSAIEHYVTKKHSPVTFNEVWKAYKENYENEDGIDMFINALTIKKMVSDDNFYEQGKLVYQQQKKIGCSFGMKLAGPFVFKKK